MFFDNAGEGAKDSVRALDAAKIFANAGILDRAAVVQGILFSVPGTLVLLPIDTDWLGRRCRNALPDKERNEIKKFPFGVTNPTVDKQLLFREKPIPFIYPVTPFKLNERITIQQGVFLAPGNLGMSFIGIRWG